MTLVAFVRSTDETISARRLVECGVRVVTVPLIRSRARDILHFLESLIRRQPFLVLRDYSKAMDKTIRSLVRGSRYDVMHIDQITMAQYAEIGRAQGARILLDEHNVVSDVVWRLALNRSWSRLPVAYEAWKLRQFERRSCNDADLVLTVTTRDTEFLINELACSTRIVTVPIGIDCERDGKTTRRPVGRTVITVGTLYYPPNAEGVEWFVRSVYPRVKRVLPDVRFMAVGARPPRRLRALTSADSSIELPGLLDEAELERLLNASAVMVVPVLAGGGMRVKILHAFASGIPVVSTTVGCEGIAVTPGKELLVADSPQRFAEAVIELLGNADQALQMADMARTLVEEKYDWAIVCDRVEAAYQFLKPN